MRPLVNVWRFSSGEKAQLYESIARLSVVVKPNMETGAYPIDTVKEVIMYRCAARTKRTIVHIYKVVEHGRRVFRTQVWTSDRSRSLAQLDSSEENLGSVLIEPVEPSPSLIIERRLNADLGRQTYLPARLIRGLSRCTPSTVHLWQDTERNIIGYQRPSAPGVNFSSTSMHSHAMLRVTPYKR